MTLTSLGWDDFFAIPFHPFSSDGFLPARVALEHKHAFELLSADREYTAACTGRLLHAATSRDQLPAVGDWVVIRPRPGERHADIHAILPRRTNQGRLEKNPQGAAHVGSDQGAGLARIFRTAAHAATERR